MQSPSGRFQLVYNGEVYNHQDIRDKLPRNYHTFRGNSDTETLAVAFDYWGIEPVIEKCDGMFALGVYDRKEQALWLARDFAGIKPLFYGLNNERLVFASQYDQVAAHPAFRQEAPDSTVLKLYLEQHYMPAPFGLLRNTGQLQPGEIMRVNAKGEVHRSRYWVMPLHDHVSKKEKRDAIDMLAEELQRSVAAEMLADVPLGAFISGGIDSPLVCYYASRQSPAGIFKAFTIGSDSRVHDESEDASTYAALMGLEHHLEHMKASDAATILQEVSAAIHEPMADFSIIPTYLVSKLASQDVKVALSGDGGDELFFGYERFWSIAKNIRLQALPYPAKYLAYGADRLLSCNRRINSAVLAPTQGQAHRGLHSRFPSSAITAVAPDLAQVHTPDNFEVYNYPLTNNLPQLLLHMRSAEFYGMMQKTLRKVDLASMENSLEVRVPF
jgi:asparagine synthase (glutamine-hydrolysing)